MKLRHFAAASLLVVSTISAQLPDWVSFPVTNPTRTFIEAHIVVVQEASAVHAFSTFTRRWASQPTTSPTAQFYGYDDHTIVEDGSTYYAYASRYGAFVPLVTTSTSPFMMSLASSSFLSVVVDGPDIHGFSPFTGQWSTLHTTAAGPISAAKVAAVFSDGPTVYGYSPLFGQFVPLHAASTITSATAGGYSAYATDGQAHYAYSGIRNEWTTLPSVATAIATVGIGRHGYVILNDGTNVDLFSGITGQVTRIACTQTPTITTGEQVVVLQEGYFTHVWSTITSTTGMIVTANPPMVTAQNYFAMLQDGQDLHVFSAPKGAFAPVLQGSWNVVHGYNTALAMNAAGANLGYSALLNRWVSGPTGTFAPTVTENSIVLLDVGGFLHGFSTRSGTWSTTATGTVDATIHHGSSYCARAGNELYAFNERYSHWSHTTTTSPATLTTKRETILADYGPAATAYSTWNDRWSPVTLSSPAISVLVSDDSALVQDSLGMHGFGGSCQVSTWGLYPEWWRFMTRGTQCPVHVAGEPGALAILALGFGAPPVTIPGIAGQLGVSLTNAALLFGMLPLEGMWVVPLVVPNIPGLAGLTVQTQALVLPPAGPYFTTAYPTTIL